MNAHFSCVTPNSYPVSCRCTCISSDTIPTPSILVINKLFISVLQKIMCSADPFVIVIIWDLSIIVITPLVSYETTLCNCDYTCPTVVVTYLSFSISFGHHNNFLLILVVTCKNNTVTLTLLQAWQGTWSYSFHSTGCNCISWCNHRSIDHAHHGATILVSDNIVVFVIYSVVHSHSSVVQGADWHWGPTSHPDTSPAPAYTKWSALATFILCFIFFILYMAQQVCNIIFACIVIVVSKEIKLGLHGKIMMDNASYCCMCKMSRML